MVACLALSGLPMQAATSVSHYNATWTFSEDRPTGVFANGEPWVVGPVTITRITPDNNASWDESFPGQPGPNSGSMRVTIPNTFQGYCTKLKYSSGMPHEGAYYKSELDLSRTANLPALLQPGEMLMTATGQVETGDVRSCINEICVLTVLSEVPPEGSFRPSLFSKEPRKIQYNKKDINYSVLKNLTPVPNTLSLAEVMVRLPALPWFEYDNSWVQSSYGPANNFATNGKPVSYPNDSSVYGREIAFKWSNIALWLNTSNTQEMKEAAMIRTIQCGLDIASFIRQGGVFHSDGGHKIGRKFPMLLAGLALNDQEILALAADKNPPRFSEDQSTFIVQSSDVGRVVSGGEGAQYKPEDVGLADWGVKHYNNPEYDDRRWAEDGDSGGVYYRYVTWPAMVGSVLAVDLMGRQDAWNHPAIFSYTERFRSRHGIGSGVEEQMWSHEKVATPISPLPPKGLRITQ
jgi:hypothetical protein